MAVTFYSPKFYVFNNMAAYAIEFEGKLYPTCEHAYQAAKCMDVKGKEAIRKARNPWQAKKLANDRFQSARDPEWDAKKVAVMEQILRAKLAQHPEAVEALKQSGTETIVEDSPTDYYWGEGADGSGQNILGKLWMKLRAESNADKMNKPDIAQIELAKKLLATVRHAAYATCNEDGTPHNSPLLFICNDSLTKLYVGSNSDSLHCKNFERTGKAFAVLFDSFIKDQGGVYITGVRAHECVGDELNEALRVHNAVRARRGSKLIDIAVYQKDKPAQRMYSIDIARIEIYSVVRGNDGFIASEARVTVTAAELLGNPSL